MKTLKAYIILFIATVAIAKAQQFTKAELQVSGLTCSLCAKTTEKSLKALPFVSEIKPDLMRNIYVITFKNDVPVSFDEISKKVKNSGFFVNYLKTTVDFNSTKVADNSFTVGADTYKILTTDKALTGPVSLTIVDKGFVPNSVSKKYMGKVIAETPATTTGRVYHVAAI
ncbi:heavy-metal-associated domain-containing protein [Mucilaginibacter glaciei]|uniref:Heavy-metal-associated domain-containing protein n=1 Tax=Mucilaginibacter glaciei TaxID=2772109 RepID=A0A926NXW8_9SPHI|nr:heavy metal-associated domain-containing protein [Mucilaginibacter glaciei]MBD1393868.1 heavy-metal-associated domain-containing protein [Mucilaginibacter glaciei]